MASEERKHLSGAESRKIKKRKDEEDQLLSDNMTQWLKKVKTGQPKLQEAEVVEGQSEKYPSTSMLVDADREEIIVSHEKQSEDDINTISYSDGNAANADNAEVSSLLLKVKLNEPGTWVSEIVNSHVILKGFDQGKDF